MRNEMEVPMFVKDDKPTFQEYEDSNATYVPAVVQMSATFFNT